MPKADSHENLSNREVVTLSFVHFRALSSAFLFSTRLARRLSITFYSRSESSDNYFLASNSFSAFSVPCVAFACDVISESKSIAVA